MPDATWLLVFDNAYETASLKSYYPASTKGSIIITSRRKDIEAPGSLILPVEALDQQSGAELLTAMVSPHEDSRMANELSSLLGGLPLAIVHAGDFINICAMSIAEYLRLLKDSVFSFTLGGKPCTNWQYDGSLQTALDDTLAILSPEARDLLDCVAFLDPNNIPEALFLRKGEDTPPGVLEYSVPQ